MPEQIVPGMADAIDARRLERGLRPGEFARAAGVTAQGLLPVRRGYHRSYNEVTLRGVAKALGWRQDWYTQLCDGADPATLAVDEHSDLEERVSRLEDRFDRIEALLEELTAEPEG